MTRLILTTVLCGGYRYYHLIPHMKKLRLGKVEQPVEGHTASEWQSKGSNLGSLPFLPGMSPGWVIQDVDMGLYTRMPITICIIYEWIKAGSGERTKSNILKTHDNAGMTNWNPSSLEAFCHRGLLPPGPWFSASPVGPHSLGTVGPLLFLNHTKGAHLVAVFLLSPLPEHLSPRYLPGSS